MELRYTARRPGPVNDVYACRVFGMAIPLGFALKGKNKVRAHAGNVSHSGVVEVGW